MKKITLIAGLFCAISGGAFAAGTVDVHREGEAKTLTLTNADHLADLVAQPRLAGSWWRGAVIAEQQATTVAEQQHQVLLAALSRAAMEASGTDAAAINALRQQLQAIKVTGRQFVSMRFASAKGKIRRFRGNTACGWAMNPRRLRFSV